MTAGTRWHSTSASSSEKAAGEPNFLVPNATFFVELLAFLLLFFLLASYVIPPINRAMTRRQEAIRTEFAELEQAKEKARQAEEEYRAQIADARHEAAKIREEAREQGAQIIAEAREQAHVEADRIVEHGHAQVRPSASRRSPRCAPRSARWPPSWPAGSSGESLEDDERTTRVVDRFLADLETMQAAAAAAGRTGLADAAWSLRRGAAPDLRPAERLDGSSATPRIGEELFGVAGVLRGEAALRRILTDASIEGDAKAGLAGDVFGNAVGEATLDAGQGRRRSAAGPPRATSPTCSSTSACWPGALRRRATSGRDQRRAVRGAPDRRQPPELRTRCPTRRASATDKAGLLAPLLDGKMQPATLRLVAPGGQRRRTAAIDRALDDFQHIAAPAPRRARAGAHRSRAQRRRPRPARRRHSRAVLDARSTCRSVVDPDVIGGLRVEIGDDVIDGTVASRLDDAQRRLVG